MQSNIKVLVVTNTYPTQERPGATPCIKDQVENLEELGVQVDVLFIDGARRINYLWGALKIMALSFLFSQSAMTWFMLIMDILER